MICYEILLKYIYAYFPEYAPEMSYLRERASEMYNAIIKTYGDAAKMYLGGADLVKIRTMILTRLYHQHSMLTNIDLDLMVLEMQRKTMPHDSFENRARYVGLTLQILAKRAVEEVANYAQMLMYQNDEDPIDVYDTITVEAPPYVNISRAELYQIGKKAGAF